MDKELSVLLAIIVLVIGCLLGGGLMVDNASCNAKTADIGFPHKWGVMSGCMIQPDNGVVSNLEELQKYLLDEYEYLTLNGFLADDEEHCEMYNKYVEEIESGNTLYFGDVSSDWMDSLESYIYDNGWGKNRNFKIIYGEE